MRPDAVVVGERFRRSPVLSSAAAGDPLKHRAERPRYEVAEMQRARLVAATIDAVADLGYAQLTVGAVIGRARVSRKTFYDVFVDREDCFLAAFEETLKHAELLTRAAYAEGAGWRSSVRAALSALLVLMEGDPALARLWILEAPLAGESVRARRSRLLNELALVLDEARRAMKIARQPPDITAPSVVGAILSVLHGRLMAPRQAELIELLGPLMYLIVLPYLGAVEAAKELKWADGRGRRLQQAEKPSSGEDPLDGLNMRLTYRTVKVLAVICDRPGASNREVAEYSEIIDQGQISKLLGRLARLRLIENRGLGQLKGKSNSWYLMPRGTAVVEVTRPTVRVFE